MSLGHQKGHVGGQNVIGRHGSTVEGADTVLRKMELKSWFIGVKPGTIQNFGRDSSGGKVSVTIDRNPEEKHPNTLIITFRRPRSTQKCTVEVDNLEANLPVIIADIKKIVEKEWRHAPVYDYTAENQEPEAPPELAPGKSAEALALLKLWGKRSANGDNRGRCG